MVNKRMNVLIYYLAGDLSNESYMRFLGHIKVQKEDFSITMSTLKFGNVLKMLHPKKHTVQAGINEEFKLTWLQNKLESIKNGEHLDSALLAQAWEKRIGPEKKTSFISYS
ncbi:unnamed protein product [Ceutorhynchus assimilis]|uniref:Uncharacterized protein n=1 Tax=Ceutorhynchus assimilis TaxID=467358 RepID=A0A9N9N0P0_9CUCU|nr:unnamed protein product [Ceutorhynchus assimilis]